MFNKHRRVGALPTIGYISGSHSNSQLNALEIGAFILFGLIVMMVGR
jgi:hypothetical protein